MRFFILMFILVLNVVLLCLKQLALLFLLEILEIFLSLLLVHHIVLYRTTAANTCCIAA
jgi:hypothetical protein